MRSDGVVYDGYVDGSYGSPCVEYGYVWFIRDDGVVNSGWFDDWSSYGNNSPDIDDYDRSCYTSDNGNTFYCDYGGIYKDFYGCIFSPEFNYGIHNAFYIVASGDSEYHNMYMNSYGMTSV